ncbi:DUF2207 domain-containing protein [Agromyces sp. CFH 90414]|uniref:DUF2207 domain-containing protein n=1 Tax=Agromyces agglutinans TaxID=2662258 RepID=A0A6I2F527_9MICO|nr:DUF2207 domain-containing protein [Agromyces agglutinans]MRG59464.1 DUF2207 domain-containing protein [Agromyces agglutinans]
MTDSSPILVVAVVAACLAALLLGLAIGARVRVGRLPRSLVVEYAPRRGASVMGDAVLAGQDRRAASAALLELATTRKVRLIADASSGKRATVAAEIVDDAALTARDLALLEALFGTGHPNHRVRRFSRDARVVGRRIRTLVAWTVDELTRAGLVAGVSSARQVLRSFSWLALVAICIVLLATLVAGAGAPTVIAGVALAVIIAALSVIPSGRSRRFTAAARPWREHLDGLRQYMRLAEADRIRALQAPQTAELLDVPADVQATLGTRAGRFRLHERLLPYAVLFGIEREWLRDLKLDYAELDAASLANLGDALELAHSLFLVADAIGELGELTFAVGDLVDASGGVLEAAGEVFGAIGDLAP